MRHRKKDCINIYRVENKKGETCFVGTVYECADFMGTYYRNIYYSMSKKDRYKYIKNKYKVEFSHYEEIEEKQCT